MSHLRPCIVVTVALLLLCSGAYPALVTGIAQAAFAHQANGSLIESDGHVRGSSLIGQTMEHPDAHPEYFWGRPSAASIDSATGLVASSGSNLGPLNPDLRAAVAARIAALRATGVRGDIPVDLVTASGSGIDPHISPAAAELQIARVARARGMSAGALASLVAAHTDERAFGLFGERRVNVLELNLALDR